MVEQELDSFLPAKHHGKVQGGVALVVLGTAHTFNLVTILLSVSFKIIEPM